MAYVWWSSKRRCINGPELCEQQERGGDGDIGGGVGGGGGRGGGRGGVGAGGGRGGVGAGGRGVGGGGGGVRVVEFETTMHVIKTGSL